MRINHNISAMITQSALGNADNSMGKSLEKLSTGLRVNRASDDAAGLAVSERLRAQVRGLGRAKMNAQDGIALLQIAEGALNEMDSILQRQRELAVQAASDTLTSADRSYLNVEYGQLNQEIDRIASSTQYNGMNLLNGTGFGAAGGSVLHIGANSGDSDKITIGITTISSGSLGVSSSTAGVTAQGSANSTIGTIDTAMGTVNSLRSNLGAYINRLEHAINGIANQEYNTQDAESRIRDVDFAYETTNFTRNQILVQSSTAMLGQANLAPQSVLSLLRS
ncbi:MAG: flagellin [Fibrobacter sp.]|nr:flagellin [Fibrobacter sp.]